MTPSPTFEAWAKANFLDTHKATDGGYFDAQTEAVWTGWKACEEASITSAGQEDARDAKRYRWLKLTARPGQPFDLFQKMHEAKHLVDAYNVFCTSWTGWDAAIDAAMSATTKEN